MGVLFVGAVAVFIQLRNYRNQVNDDEFSHTFYYLIVSTLLPP